MENQACNMQNKMQTPSGGTCMRNKIYRKIMAIILPAAIMLVSDLFAANLYVDKSLLTDITNGTYSIANRNASGADGNAYRTVSAAVLAMVGGDDIFIRGGTYYERDIYIDASKSGTSSNWSTMQSYPGEWAIINGERKCSGNVYAVIRNGAFVHEGSKTYAKYWIFERLEITGGGLSGASVASAAGIWWNTGPVVVRYCYIHDNLADNADENPAGFNGCSQQYAVIEYCYFKNNGSLNQEHGNARNICLTSSTGYSSTPYDENWYVKGNVIRYNLVDAEGAGGIDTKSHQFLTSDRSGSDKTRKAWGDQIHHNIVRNAKYGAIFHQQDFVQIHNNVVVMHSGAGEEDWGIATRRMRTDGVDTIGSVVYNNTLINTKAAAIFNGYEGQNNTAAIWWVYNNIIDNHVDDWDRNEISIGSELTSIDISKVHIDRNYFYRSNNDYIATLGSSDLTASTFESTFAGTDLYVRRTADTTNLLYVSTSGADAYKTRGTHVMEGTKTIASGGIGGSHPYLDGVTFPTYIGATDPNNSSWVNTVNSLSNVNILKAGGDTTYATDTNPPAKPTGTVLSIVQ